MRPYFTVPSKLILFGEHAVVHGYAAIATALSKRMTMKYSISNSNETSSNLIDDDLKTIFNPFGSLPTNATQRDKMLYSAFRSVFPKNTYHIEIKSSGPNTGGLGSSAGFCTLIAKAASIFSGQNLSKDSLFKEAKRLENFFHFNGSGLDPAIVIYGGSIKMEKGKIEPISIPPIDILVVNTGVKHSTAQAVSHVSNLLKQNSSLYGLALKKLGNISNSFVSTPNNQKKQFLIKNIPIAQDLLAKFDLNCPESEDIVKIAEKNNLVAKISGAGMGGIMIVTGDDLLEKKSLFSKYQNFYATIGAPGFETHYDIH